MEYGTVFDLLRQDVILEVKYPSGNRWEAQHRGTRPSRLGESFLACNDKTLAFKSHQKISVLDFASRAVTPGDTDSTWGLFSRLDPRADYLLSPSETRIAYMQAEPDGRSTLFVLEGSAGPRKLVTGLSFSIGPRVSPYSASPPFAWQDNVTIVTQRGNGKLLVVRFEGTVTELPEVDPGNDPHLSPHIYRDKGGRILYRLSETWVVDVASGAPKPAVDESVGHGFAVSPRSLFPCKGNLKIAYQGQEIAKDVCSGDLVTTRGGIALACCDGVGEGVRVWNVQSRAWSTMGTRRAELIGWTGEFRSAGDSG